MQSTSQRIEEKQELLKQLDPEKEQHLDEMFVDYVGSVYHDANTTKEEKAREVEEAEAIYERALDEAIAEYRRDFYRVWDESDEETRATMYPYLQDHAKVWLDEREA